MARLADLQARLLARAAAAVRPGGALTYAVCTLTRAETLEVVDGLLAGGGWTADDLGAAWPGFAHPLSGGFLLVLPPDGGTPASSSLVCGARAARQPAPTGRRKVDCPCGASRGGDEIGGTVEDILRGINIAPSILSADFSRLGEESRRSSTPVHASSTWT